MTVSKNDIIKTIKNTKDTSSIDIARNNKRYFRSHKLGCDCPCDGCLVENLMLFRFSNDVEHEIVNKGLLSSCKETLIKTYIVLSDSYDKDDSVETITKKAFDEIYKYICCYDTCDMEV